MKVESEDFHVPAPPRTSKPSSPADPVTFLEADSSAWTKHGAAWRPQAAEVILSVLAMFCWTTMCVLDLWGWGAHSEGRAVSLILSLGILAVSCIVFATRHCCVSRILRKDLNGVAGESTQVRCQLLILLASQWSLLGGAIIWFVFHASSERLPQVIAGLVAVFILLLLLLCSLVYVLVVQRKLVAAPGTPKEPSNVATRSSHCSEDLALASIDPQADLAPERLSVRSYPSALKQRLEVTTRSETSDDAMSDNYIGHLMSSPSPGRSSPGRSSIRSSFRVQVNVEPAESEEKDGGEMRNVKSVEFEKPRISTSEEKEEVIRSSCGRWRPLFPTMASATCFSPTMSRTSMLSWGGELRRGTSVHSKGFRFETEAEVEQSLVKEIKRHTLEVNSTILRSSSPSPSLGSLPSQQSSKKVKSSRASSSSGLTDDSG